MQSSLLTGPANKEDRLKLVETLTTPNIIEWGKLYDAMIQFRFARNRWKKYGYREPEPSQLFETLRAASTALSEKEPELGFSFSPLLDEAQ